MWYRDKEQCIPHLVAMAEILIPTSSQHFWDQTSKDINLGNVDGHRRSSRKSHRVDGGDELVGEPSQVLNLLYPARS